MKRDRSGAVAVLPNLMANGVDSDKVATQFESSNEPGIYEGNDEFTLPFVQGANGIAASVRRELQRSKRAADGVAEVRHCVEVWSNIRRRVQLLHGPTPALTDIPAPPVHGPRPRRPRPTLLFRHADHVQPG